MFSILQLSQITKCPFSVHAAQDAQDGRDSARGVRAAPPPARDRERRVGDRADRLRQHPRAPPAFSLFLLPTSSSASCFFASLLPYFFTSLLLCIFFASCSHSHLPKCTESGDNCFLLCFLRFFVPSFLRSFMLLASGFGADCGLEVQKHQVEQLRGARAIVKHDVCFARTTR